MRLALPGARAVTAAPDSRAHAPRPAGAVNARRVALPAVLTAATRPVRRPGKEAP